MSPKCSSMVKPLVWILYFWIVGHVKGCGDQQTKMNGLCCDKCSPGTYLQKFCSKENKTSCAPCQDGEFADEYHSFDRCDKCQSCSQEYAKKCTPTTNAVCTCYPGFLCSDELCSRCEKNTFDTVQRSTKTALEEYPYSSVVDSCLEDEYFDVITNLCKPTKKKNAHGINEQLPQNKAHNGNETKGFEKDFLVWGFVLLSLALFVFVAYKVLEKTRKHRAKNNPIPAVNVNTDNFHLSKEESGLLFIIQDESKDSSSLC